MPTHTIDILRHLSAKPGHDEVKAGFRQLLVDEFGASLDDIDFERRVPEVRGRLDALAGRTIFEAKADLTKEWRDVERRMPEYLADREREEGERYTGIASDGLRWVVVELRDGALEIVKETLLDPDRPERFLAFLDGALALKASIPPDPLNVRIELGGDSIAYRRAEEAMAAIWERVRLTPATALKRQLWARLLTLVYGRTIESDKLWFQHTFLVIVAKAIAFAVTGLRDDEPASMMSGQAFRDQSIYGAVESDFFDWVLADPDGDALVRRIVNHIRRFRLAEVESDVLKVLYESLIDREERHGLGEYYTPDWLAAKIVRRAVARPIEQRVLDPACGSGTFLFHAIRRFLAEADEVGVPEETLAAEVTAHVAGLDIHPVAVIIARVTYLLGLAPVIASRAGAITLPVYLGDAMQLDTKRLMTREELAIEVPPAPTNTGSARTFLEFPEVFCRDPGLFDKTINAVRDASEREFARKQFEQNLFRIVEQHYRRDPTQEELDGIADFGSTFEIFDSLRREGRDTIWAYVARNLSRPLFLSAAGGWANVLVGNPPWVALRHMTAELQKRFKELAKIERVYVGGKLATQNDLCALFVVRAAALYLRSGGRLAFVLPLAALSRGQFERLMAGSFTSAKIAWEEAWTMDDSVQPLFPVPSCVIFGQRRRLSRKLPASVRAYSGDLPFRDAPEEIADARLTVTEGAPALERASFEGGSVYRGAFRQGATLVPRFLCLVERKTVGRLGGDPTRPLVTSRRSSQEKPPWKSLPKIEHRVEARFLRPIYLGESILPFRAWRPVEGVVPVDEDGTVLDARRAADRGWVGLNEWMTSAERLWLENRSGNMSLIQQFDYYGKLSSQFPIPKLRVVYSKAGTLPVACLLQDADAVCDHKLYWYAPTTIDEGRYLVAILGSEAARLRVANRQSRGQWGARDFDKVMFGLPILRFDARLELHTELAQVSAEAEDLATAVDIPEGMQFQSGRRRVREALADAGLSDRIDRLVTRLIDGG